MSQPPDPAEQLARLQSLCDRTPNAVLFQVHDVAGAPPRFVYISGGIEATLGVTPEQVIADPAAFLATILPDDLPAFDSARNAARAAGRAFEHTFRQRTKAGEVRWIQFRAVPTRRPDGSVVWDGLTQDMTAWRHLVHSFQESEARLRAFMDHSPAVAWMKDVDGRYVYLSRPFEERFRVRLADLAGKTDFDLWPEELARQYVENDRLVLRDNRQVAVVENSKEPDGTVGSWWSFKFPFADSAGRRYVGGLAVDVTERERVKSELRRKNDEIQAVLDQVQRLEKSLVTMCAWTRTVKMGDRWVPVEEFLQKTFGVRVSHGISDDALRKLEEDFRANPPQ